MSKPQWLIDKKEHKPSRILIPRCIDCLHIGTPLRYVKHKDKTRVVLFECAKHPGCYNTQFSLACDDWEDNGRPEGKNPWKDYSLE